MAGFEPATKALTVPCATAAPHSNIGDLDGTRTRGLSRDRGMFSPTKLPDQKQEWLLHHSPAWLLDHITLRFVRPNGGCCLLYLEGYRFTIFRRLVVAIQSRLPMDKAKGLLFYMANPKRACIHLSRVGVPSRSSTEFSRICSPAP